MEDAARRLIQEALPVEYPDPNFADRVFAALPDARKPERQMFKSAVGAIAIIGAAAVAGTIVFATHVQRISTAAGPVRNGYGACEMAQIKLTATIAGGLNERVVVISAANAPSICRFEVPVGLLIRDPAGHDLAVHGNGAVSVLKGEPVADSQLPSRPASIGFSWANWCGEARVFSLVTLSSVGQNAKLFVADTPPCLNQSAPSTLTVLPGSPLNPYAHGVRPGIPYPYQLVTHCGVWADFDASAWDVVRGPLTLLSDPFQDGVMTLLDSGHARFDFRQGSIFFTRHQGTMTKSGCA